MSQHNLNVWSADQDRALASALSMFEKRVREYSNGHILRACMKIRLIDPGMKANEIFVEDLFILLGRIADSMRSPGVKRTILEAPGLADFVRETLRNVSRLAPPVEGGDEIVPPSKDSGGTHQIRLRHC